MTRGQPALLLHLSVLALASVGTSVARAADESAQAVRLERMPIVHRLQLAETLNRFDALSDGEQAAVRGLDEAVSRLDPAVQARYRVVLRKYHAWIATLDDAKKTELVTAPTVDAKLALVARWKKAERATGDGVKSKLVLGVHPGDLGGMPPFEMANLMRVWFGIDDKEKARIDSMKLLSNRIDELRRIGIEKQMIFHRFPPQEEAAIVARLEANEKVKQIFPNYAKRADLPATKKKAENRPGPLANPLHHLAESIYFSEHPPRPVALVNLVRFEAELPRWFRGSLDPLPPEDANRRLTILYRLIYPHPEEMPPPKVKSDPSRVVPETKPKPAATAPSPTPF